MFISMAIKLQNYINLSIHLTLVGLCRIKCNHPVNFYFIVGAMLPAFHKLHSKPKTIPELKSALQQIWDDLPQTTINKDYY